MKNDPPKAPVSEKEKRVADYVVQCIFIVALCVCVLIDALSEKFELHFIVYTILGSGAIGADNFINILNKLRGK